MNTRQAVVVGLMCGVVVACQTKPVQTVPANVPRAPLPATLPDSLMQRNRWALAPEHTDSLFLRGIVAVHFTLDATAHDRELAMRSVNGFAVARTPGGSGPGIYYLKLVVDRPDSAVFRAIRVLRQNPAVRNAVPEMVSRDKVTNVANRPPD
jgi:hypothetical protein